MYSRELLGLATQNESVHSEIMQAAQSSARRSGFEWGPWLWDPRADLTVFGGSALLGLVISAAAVWWGVGALPEAGWILLVLGVDVAHVHATWIRTYFDGVELRRHPLRYGLVPLLAYAAAVWLYQLGPLLFWRGLAYLAVFHFVRQQVGWVALYRARSGDTTRLTRFTDTLASYAATLFPLFYWHVHAASKQSAWFVRGDFVVLPLAAWLPVATALWAASLGAFVLRELWRAWWTRRVELGKSCVVLTTAVSWYVGIVAWDSDTVFTATNVLPHGLPYLWLLFVYGRRRAQAGDGWLPAAWLARGFGLFWAGLLLLAAVEELAWDRFVDHDRAWLFGEGALLSASALGWLVPLLALPQLLHYVLDGLLWRRSESRVRQAQSVALGFTRARDVRTLPWARAPLGHGGSK